MRTRIFILICLSFSILLNAQKGKKDVVKSDTIQINPALNLAVNDTILVDKIVLKEHKEVTLIDSLWREEMYFSPLYDTIQYVIDIDAISEVDLPELPTDTLKTRLALLDSETPFNIEYNQGLERVIRSYLKNRRKTFSILMSRAQYIFQCLKSI